MTSAPGTIRRRLKELRERRGYSVPALVERCEALGLDRLTREAISNIEQGRKRVLVDELLALAWALDVTPIHLLLDPESSDLVIGNTSTQLGMEWLVGLAEPTDDDPIWSETHPSMAIRFALIDRMVRRAAEQSEAIAAYLDAREQATKSTTKKGAGRGQR